MSAPRTHHGEGNQYSVFSNLWCVLVGDGALTISKRLVGTTQVRKVVYKRFTYSRTCVARCYSNYYVATGEAIGDEGNCLDKMLPNRVSPTVCCVSCANRDVATGEAIGDEENCLDKMLPNRIAPTRCCAWREAWRDEL